MNKIRNNCIEVQLSKEGGLAEGLCDRGRF